jgi:hypothetical protein
MRVLDSDPGALNSKDVSRTSDRRFGQLGAASTILLVLTFTTGFGNDPQPSENAQPAERFARSTYPIGPWVRESEFPKPSPKSPLMVIREVTQYAPGTEPTAEQAKAAQELIESCYESAIRNGWNDYDMGLADGFEPPPRDPRHFRNREFMLDSEILDPGRPEVLMYYPTVGGIDGTCRLHVHGEQPIAMGAAGGRASHRLALPHLAQEAVRRPRGDLARFRRRR